MEFLRHVYLVWLVLTCLVIFINIGTALKAGRLSDYETK